MKYVSKVLGRYEPPEQLQHGLNLPPKKSVLEQWTPFFQEYCLSQCFDDGAMVYSKI